MRVLFVIDTLAVGGAERSLLELARRFRRIAPTVLTLYAAEHVLQPEFEAAGIPVRALNLPARYALRRAVQGVLAAVRASTPDLLHASLFRSGATCRIVSRLTGLPLVDTFVSDSYGRARQEVLPRGLRLKLRVVQSVDRLTAPLVHRFIANSDAVARANIHNLGLPSDRVVVVHRGRDPARYLPSTSARIDEVRRAAGVSPGADVILNVGRLVPEKGQSDLLEALPTVLSARPQVVALIAGAGPEHGRLRARAEALGLGASVRLLGARADVPDLLQAADAFCFPSRLEGLPGALIEAMLAGLPIVAADTPTNREAVDATCALLAPPAAPPELAAALLQLLGDRDLAARLGEAARIRAAHRFDIERQAAAYEDALFAAITARAGVRS